MKEKDNIQEKISKILVEGAKKIKEIEGDTREKKWASLLSNIVSPLSKSILVLTKEIASMKKTILKNEDIINRLEKSMETTKKIKIH